MKNTQRGFTLLISIIFMSVMLSFGLALGSLGYKQQVLVSSAIESQYAFYTADGALECALYADQQNNLFAYEDYVEDDNPPKIMTCGGNQITMNQAPPANGYLVSTARMSLDSRCADITVYKPVSGTTYIYSVGYNTSCGAVGSARSVSRGLSTHFSN